MSEKMTTNGETKATYDKAAQAYAEKYEKMGARKVDVNRAMELWQAETRVGTAPQIVEIGPGNGREAEYILTLTDQYTGVDFSQEMIALAREKVPTATFVHANIVNYSFPENTDIILAFASLLHVSKEELEGIVAKAHIALSENGIIYLSLKRADVYYDQIQYDEFGGRHFFYYTKEDVLGVADGFEEVWYEEQDRDEPWLTLVLRKK